MNTPGSPSTPPQQPTVSRNLPPAPRLTYQQARTNDAMLREQYASMAQRLQRLRQQGFVPQNEEEREAIVRMQETVARLRNLLGNTRPGVADDLPPLQLDSEPLQPRQPENNISCLEVPQDAPAGMCEANNEGEEVDMITFDPLRDADGYLPGVLNVRPPTGQCILRSTYDQLPDVVQNGLTIKTNPFNRAALFCSGGSPSSVANASLRRKDCLGL